MVLMLYRDDYHEPGTERAGEPTYGVRKNRNGPLAENVLRYDTRAWTFTPLAA